MIAGSSATALAAHRAFAVQCPGLERTVKRVTVQTLKLRGQRYVLLREKDFNALKIKARTGKPGKGRRLTAQERGDVAEALRRLSDPNDREIPYEQARKRLGLA